MKKCTICGTPLTVGMVVCGCCAEKWKQSELSLDTWYFIQQLAKEIALSKGTDKCRMCVSVCHCQVSGPGCIPGVTAWLRGRAEQYFKQKEGK